MNKFAMGCGVLLAILLFIVVIAALALGGSYNRLVRSQQTVDQSWAQVQNVYQRRADLIPNLVNTVDRKSTRLNSSHRTISYAVFCLKKKNDSPDTRLTPDVA